MNFWWQMFTVTPQPVVRANVWCNSGQIHAVMWTWLILLVALKVSRFIFLPRQTVNFQLVVCCFSLSIHRTTIWDIWLTWDLQSCLTATRHTHHHDNNLHLPLICDGDCVTQIVLWDGPSWVGLAGNGCKIAVWHSTSKANKIKRTIYNVQVPSICYLFIFQLFHWNI